MDAATLGLDDRVAAFVMASPPSPPDGVDRTVRPATPTGRARPSSSGPPGPTLTRPAVVGPDAAGCGPRGRPARHRRPAAEAGCPVGLRDRSVDRSVVRVVDGLAARPRATLPRRGDPPDTREPQLEGSSEDPASEAIVECSGSDTPAPAPGSATDVGDGVHGTPSALPPGPARRGGPRRRRTGTPSALPPGPAAADAGAGRQGGALPCCPARSGSIAVGVVGGKPWTFCLRRPGRPGRS